MNQTLARATRRRLVHRVEPGSSSGSGVESHKETITDAAGASVTINHGLGTLDVLVQVIDLQTGGPADPTVERIDTNSLFLHFDTTPESGRFRVLILAL